MLAIQQDENMLERQSTSKLQSAIYYALDGDQVNVLTMLTQRCEEPWVSVTLFDTMTTIMYILLILGADAFPSEEALIVFGM